ncbi:MAG: biopolymer transporter ExbD [Gemmatimonadetes bacterium]|nr:biopolymer transporter ExbD [Gemmatimonadota bacterium]
MPLINQKRIKVSSEIPTASMADIAFLLMIFFLVTTTFPKDRGLAILLPEEGVEAQVSQSNVLHLIIQPNGIIDVRRGESQQVQQIRPQEVEAVWRQEVTANPNVIAAVKTHPQAPYRYMIDVLDALHAANAERISLQILEE